MPRGSGEEEHLDLVIDLSLKFIEIQERERERERGGREEFEQNREKKRVSSGYFAYCVGSYSCLICCIQH